MGWKRPSLSVAGLAVAMALITLPIWGMGVAIFLDSERKVVSRQLSPSGKRIAQVERIVVGGVPSIVVMARPRWMPDRYLFGCAATSHYGDATAQLRWASEKMLVAKVESPAGWWLGSAPFHHGSCSGLSMAFEQTGA